MIESGRKIEEIPEFAPVLKIIDNPIKAKILFLFHNNPTLDEDSAGIARHLGSEKIKVIANNMTALAKTGLFETKVEGVIRTNFYHLAPGGRMEEAINLLFGQEGTRNYWNEFKDYLHKIEAGRKRRQRWIKILLAVLLSIGLVFAGFFIYKNFNAQRARKQEELSQESGVRKTKYPNGKLKSEIMYSHGDRHGPFSAWFENGNKMAMGSYQNNLPHGKWTFWDQTGKKIKTVTYQEGQAVFK